MKNRTIEELHDKHVGHKKFAKICDLLTQEGYVITDIREYNKFFKFKVNNKEYQYRKEWKSSAKDFAKYFINVFKTQEDLENKCSNVWRS